MISMVEFFFYIYTITHKVYYAFTKVKTGYVISTAIQYKVTVLKVTVMIRKHWVREFIPLQNLNEMSNPNVKKNHFTTEYFTPENFTVLQKTLLNVKYFCLQKLGQLKFILAFENWQSIIILILIDVLEYE